VAEGDGEVVGLVAVQQIAAQLGRLAERDREHARGERIERAAVADLDLAVPPRRNAPFSRPTTWAEVRPSGLVDDEPAVGAGH
jgi:hypothetical protein